MEADEKARKEEEARQASIAQSIAESQAASEAAERERTREEAERQASIDASIAEEQRKIAESKAIEESIKNSSIAESVSIEESSRQESLSIQESIEESEEEESRSLAEESESIAESISESESEDARTRAYEVGQDYFVPWEYNSDSGRFLFAVDDTNIEAPEGYEKTDLIVNKQYVWAAQSEKTAARTYLVYGTYDEGIEPAFYYFDLDTGRLFPYDNLNSRTDNRPARIETEESTTAAETVPGKTDGFPLDRAILFAVSGAVIGAALFGLLLLLLKIGRNRNTAEPRIFADDPEDPLIPSAGDIDDLEELPLQKEDVSDPDETMKILFGQEAEENQFVNENAEDEIELAIVEEDSVAKTIEEPDPSTIEDESELAVVEEESELPVEEAEAAVKLPKPEDEISLTETPEAAASETIESVPEPAAEPAEEVSPETPAADASSDAIPVIPAVPAETVSDFDKQPDVPKEPPIPDEDLIIPETEEEVPSSETLSSEPAAVGEPILEDDDVEIISEDEVELDSVFDRKS
ncbi:MAG: hypothetical protein IKS18_09745 [Lachnospiraceae bacterium]|nr:hypothetical protein [Lachnospiraceae bacterium]